MKSPVCEMFGIDFPLVAFTHCRDVVVEVSKAGGLGVLGAAGYGPETLEIELNWIDEHIDGKPYGVDLIAPTSMAVTDDTTPDETLDMVPDEHRDFARGVLAQHNIDTSDVYQNQRGASGGFLTKSRAGNIIDVAFSHPIRLIANALGVPPKYMLDMAKSRGVVAAALVGAKEHAIKQVDAGVELLVVAGTEAGGHCGEVSTMVLVPEVIDAIERHGKPAPVLAAGGIVTGRQMAACMAIGSGWRLDRLRLAHDCGSRDIARHQGEIRRGQFAPDGSLAGPHRQVFAPVALALDGTPGSPTKRRSRCRCPCNRW